VTKAAGRKAAPALTLAGRLTLRSLALIAVLAVRVHRQRLLSRSCSPAAIWSADAAIRANDNRIRPGRSFRHDVRASIEGTLGNWYPDARTGRRAGPGPLQKPVRRRRFPARLIAVHPGCWSTFREFATSIPGTQVDRVTAWKDGPRCVIDPSDVPFAETRVIRFRAGLPERFVPIGPRQRRPP